MMNRSVVKIYITQRVKYAQVLLLNKKRNILQNVTQIRRNAVLCNEPDKNLYVQHITLMQFKITAYIYNYFK
jgi:hypothetical protein